MEPDGGQGHGEVADIGPNLDPHGEHDEDGGEAEGGEHVAYHGRKVDLNVGGGPGDHSVADDDGHGVEAGHGAGGGVHVELEVVHVAVRLGQVDHLRPGVGVGQLHIGLVDNPELLDGVIENIEGQTELLLVVQLEFLAQHSWKLYASDLTGGALPGVGDLNLGIGDTYAGQHLDHDGHGDKLGFRGKGLDSLDEVTSSLELLHRLPGHEVIGRLDRLLASDRHLLLGFEGEIGSVDD